MEDPAGPVFVHPGMYRLPPIDSQMIPIGELPADAPDEAAADLQIPQLPAAEVVVVEAEPEQVPESWEGGFELGLDGSEGNSETFNLRFGFNAKRSSKRNVFALDLDYRKTTNKFVETANRTFLDWRYERLFEESRWTSFVHGTVDYDEFQAFDVRATMDIGLGFQIAKNETTSLAARFGSGFSREIGGPDDAYVPEAVIGLEFEHRFNKNHKLTASSQYTPDLTGWNDFRLKSKASWEALIDEEMNLSLKLSVLDRHDSTPHGAKPNDLDYSAVVLWKF